MNPNELLRRFPNASKSILAANPAVGADVAPETRLRHEQPEQWRETLAHGEGREIHRAGCPIVRITLRRCRLFDWDGKWSTIKGLVDGLVKSGLLHGDREDQIDPQSWLRQEKVAHLKDQETLISITYP